jgi:hypothetical protein
MARRRKNRRGKEASKRSGDEFQLLRHPFNGIDPEVLKKAFVGVGENAAKEYPELIETLLGQLRSWSPLHLMATLATWGLYSGVTDDGATGKPIMSKVEQHHVELLQAFAMMLPVEEWGRDPANPYQVPEVIETVGKLAEAFLHQRYQEMAQERDLQQRTVLLLQEGIRGHTQVVRNWGYFSDVVQISTELYAALDAEFEVHHGFSPTDLIEAARCLTAIIEKRTSDRFVTLKKVFRGRSIPQFVRLYYKHFPDLAGGPDKFVAALPPDVTLQQVKLITLSHADLSLAESLFAPLDEIAEMSGRDLGKVRKALDALAMTIGSLKGTNVDHVFMANPVWNAPLVRIGSDFFIAIPQSIFSHIHPIMRHLFDEAGLKEKLEDRRAAYLEWKLEQTIRKAIPKARVIPNAEWTTGGVQYETDLIVTLDRVVLLFEAKSAGLTQAGLRGAPQAARNHVRDLVVAPSQQSARLADIIRSAKDGDAAALAVTQSLKVDVANVDTIARVSVTLDDFSVLSSLEGNLKEAGWVPEDLPLALTLNVADFGVVADILSDPIFFIHYLNERSRIQKVTDLMGDELDYLGFYLETGFNLGELEKGEYRLAISGMSGPIDRYYTSRDAGVAIAKPKPKIHPYFAKVLREIGDRDFESWTTAALDILRSASHDEQRQAVRGMERVRLSVRKNFRDPKHECCMVIIPPEGRDGLVLFYVYPQALAAQRNDTVSLLAAETLGAHGRARCTVVGRKLEEWNRPYQFVMIATPPKEDE